MRSPRLVEAQYSGIGREMEQIGVDPRGIDIMKGKARHRLIRLDDVDLRAALILKQDMLSLGGEAALHRKAAGLSIRTTPVILMGTEKQLRELVSKLAEQPFGLSELGLSIDRVLDACVKAPRYVVGDTDLFSNRRKAVVGILNVTPDSFSDGGKYLDRKAAVARGMEMAAQGADIIDVGGESTRPGAGPVGTVEEQERVIPVVRELAREGIKAISVDTTSSEVARKAIDEGAGIINDISAMTFDPEMFQAAAAGGASVILMHTRGRPETMQDDLQYDDLMEEVLNRLETALDRAVANGISPERICLDPGVGFGKSVEQNLELLSRIGELRSLGTCVMVGASRKSFIGRLTGGEIGSRLAGSIAAAVAAVLNGADMVRVHDVAETVQALAVADGIRGAAGC